MRTAKNFKVFHMFGDAPPPPPPTLAPAKSIVITELPTKPRGSWRVQMIKKAFCLYLMFVCLSCRCAFFATLIFEIQQQVCCFSVCSQESLSSSRKLFCCSWRCFEKDDLLGEDIHKLSCWSYSQRECPWKVCYCIETEKNNDMWRKI